MDQDQVHSVLVLIQEEGGVGSQQVQKTIALTAEQGQQDTAHNSTERPARAWQLLYNRFSVTYLFLLAFSFPASAFFQGNYGTCTSLKIEPPQFLDSQSQPSSIIELGGLSG